MGRRLRLATLRDLADACRHQLLAAGDFNEARGWDVLHPGETWGAEYFKAVGAAGLVDCLHRVWPDEEPTRGEYQLDHVFATTDVASKVKDPLILASSGSDHAPIAFTLG